MSERNGDDNFDKDVFINNFCAIGVIFESKIDVATNVDSDDFGCYGEVGRKLLLNKW